MMILNTLNILLINKSTGFCDYNLFIFLERDLSDTDHQTRYFQEFFKEYFPKFLKVSYFLKVFLFVAVGLIALVFIDASPSVLTPA